MRPKGKLFALFAVFAAIGLVTASGAFTTVEADRTAEVDVAGDANALVAISPTGGENGNAYAQTNAGQTEINLNGEFTDGNNPEGQGVNINATTEIDSVITITNQGSQEVGIHIEPNGANSEAITFFNGSDTSGTDMTGSTNTQTVGAGEEITVSIQVETDDSFSAGEEIISNMTVVAEESNA